MKSKTLFACQNCGYTSPKWLGRCPGCESWNSLVEEKIQSNAGSVASLQQEIRSEFQGAPKNGKKLHALGEVPIEEPGPTEGAVAKNRWSTGMKELDRVLGGGLVKDSFVLLGGDPGIGKSTILLQMAQGVSKQSTILYLSGEESLDQVQMRASRLGIGGNGRIFLASETQLESAFDTIRELKPQVVIVDSIQTFSTNQLDSAPGSVSQVREVASRLMTLAKNASISVWIVGHVTKEGSIAGPKVVEHLVDTVLYFEGEGSYSYRLLRSVKNRFGSSRELGVFEMTGEGLVEVSNPSSLFVMERPAPLPGVAVTASLEGTRPLLVEMQALVASSPLSMPRRTALGIESSRLSILSAIIEKHLGLNLSNQDLFFNVAGGLKLTEPACDLAAAASIASSFKGKPLPAHCVFIGELGLTGEVRRVSFPELRCEEAKKLGYSTIVLPAANKERCKSISKVELIPIQRIADLSRLIS